jgi:hypothetical protein
MCYVIHEYSRIFTFGEIQVTDIVTLCTWCCKEGGKKKIAVNICLLFLLNMASLSYNSHLIFMVTEIAQ